MAEQRDVFREYSSEITTTVLLKAKDEFVWLTIEFQAKGIIGEIAMIEYQRTGGMKGVSDLFTAVRMYIDGDTNEKKARIICVLKIMDKVIPDIVKRMREEYDPVASIKIPECNPPKGLEDTDGGDSKFKVFLSFKWDREKVKF